MTLLAELQALANPARAEQSAAYHKSRRKHLGVDNPVLNTMAAGARRSLSQDQRLAEAEALWAANFHESRILAAKLFDQRHIPADQPVWELLCAFVPDFDAWAIADHVCKSLALRLAANPERLDTVAIWTRSQNFWIRRAALVSTLGWASM